MRITNLTRSPYDLPIKRGGKIRLGAFETIECDCEFRADYFTLLQASKTIRVEVSDDTQKDDTLTTLRETYQTIVGKKAYHGWDAEELQTRINDAMNADDV